MKQLIFLIVFYGCFSSNASGQDSTKVTLDLLRAPSSPGAILLGFAPSEIERPSDVSGFMTTIQTASSGFTKFPSNYAIDVAPFWLTKKTSGFTTASLNATKFKDVFRQTLVISMAIRNADTVDKRFNGKSTYSGFGFKFNLIRGNFSKNTAAILDAISDIQNSIVLGMDTSAAKLFKKDAVMIVTTIKLNLLEDMFGPEVENNPQYKILQKILEARQKRIVDSLQQKQKELPRLKSLAENFKINRTGWYWDIAGGGSIEFINGSFTNSKIYNAGLWTTFGNTTEKGVSILFIGRYLYNPKMEYQESNSINTIGNISTLDVGTRLAFANSDNKFLFSGEAIYRNTLSNRIIPATWKLALNIEYDINKNQKLTFVFGKAFDGTISKDGSLIAALNLLAGFGNKR